VKALEIILAVLAVLFGLLAALCGAADCPRTSAVLGGAAVVLCGIWLLMRSV